MQTSELTSIPSGQGCYGYTSQQGGNTTWR